MVPQFSFAVLKPVFFKTKRLNASTSYKLKTGEPLLNHGKPKAKPKTCSYRWVGRPCD
jgi:hypothetical protein